MKHRILKKKKKYNSFSDKNNNNKNDNNDDNTFAHTYIHVPFEIKRRTKEK